MNMNSQECEYSYMLPLIEILMLFHRPCGLMDQMASIHGVAGHALLFDCRSLHIETIPVQQEEYVFLVVNSNVKHSHASGEYSVRRKSCEEVASLLGKSSLRDVSMRELESSQSSLSDELYRIARHVLTENERTLTAADALKRGDITVLGALMTQVSMFTRDNEIGFNDCFISESSFSKR